MELLVLESATDDAVQKSSVKGLGAVTTVARSAASSSDVRLTRPSTNGDRPASLEHTNTNTSVTTLEGDAKAMFPFRIKHLGKSEVYTLYAPTAQNRQDWCDKILMAKERHAGQ